ncbi:MAG TPA: hypothetical protein VHW01_19920 [Polyangiaceae bacterium]|jgi:hypothetical protein|nr:hypothetical protein [Polyangiaceae bacterium]
MKRPFSLKSSLLLAFAIGGCLAVSCQENGATSICPSLPLYETHPLGDASIADAGTADSPAVRADLARAIDAGCITAPSLFPSDGGMSGDGPTENRVGGGGASGTGSKASAAGSD